MSRVICEEIKCTLNIASVFFAHFDSSVCGRHGGTRKPSGDHAVVEAVASGEPVGAANGLFSIHENCLLLLVRKDEPLRFQKAAMRPNRISYFYFITAFPCYHGLFAEFEELGKCKKSARQHSLPGRGWNVFTSHASSAAGRRSQRPQRQRSRSAKR